MSTQGISVASEVLGITDPSRVGRSFTEAHLTLTGGPYNPNYYDAIAAKPHEERTLTERERFLDFRTIGELVIENTVVSASTFTDWTIYNSMMRQYGTRSDGNASALMIGSLTPLSSRSFVCLADTEYGAKDVHIIDPVSGRDKLRHGKFVYGSGLALPYASGSMDFVHTNQLLHMLKDPGSPSRPEKQKMWLLFSEISRVLAPGGQLLMKEAGPKAIKASTENVQELLDEQEQLCTFAATALRRFGIDYARAGLAPVHNDVDALRDPERNFGKYLLGINARAVNIYARKRPHLHAQPMPGKIAL
jgi:SAM-dependent methyltransferase